jgi:hypothetical protein
MRHAENWSAYLARIASQTPGSESGRKEPDR